MRQVGWDRAGCVSGEGQNAESAGDGSALKGQVLNIDFAIYNPLSLVIKKQGLARGRGRRGQLGAVGGFQ